MGGSGKERRAGRWEFPQPFRYDKLSVAFVNSCRMFNCARSQSFEKRLIASLCQSVCLEQLSCNWTDFREILY